MIRTLTKKVCYNPVLAAFSADRHVSLEGTPLSVEITSSTAGEYHVVPTIQSINDPDEPQDTSLAQWFVIGDTYFRQNFPDVYLINLYVSLVNPETTYDLTVVMEWGAGVSNEPATWDQVKSLYR